MFMHKKYTNLQPFLLNLFLSKNWSSCIHNHSSFMFTVHPYRFNDFFGVVTFWSAAEFLEHAFNLHESSMIFTHIIIPTSYNNRYRHIILFSIHHQYHNQVFPALALSPHYSRPRHCSSTGGKETY